PFCRVPADRLEQPATRRLHGGPPRPDRREALLPRRGLAARRASPSHAWRAPETHTVANDREEPPSSPRISERHSLSRLSAPARQDPYRFPRSRARIRTDRTAGNLADEPPPAHVSAWSGSTHSTNSAHPERHLDSGTVRTSPVFRLVAAARDRQRPAGRQDRRRTHYPGDRRRNRLPRAGGRPATKRDRRGLGSRAAYVPLPSLYPR